KRFAFSPPLLVVQLEYSKRKEKRPFLIPFLFRLNCLLPPRETILLTVLPILLVVNEHKRKGRQEDKKKSGPCRVAFILQTIIGLCSALGSKRVSNCHCSSSSLPVTVAHTYLNRFMSLRFFFFFCTFCNIRQVLRGNSRRCSRKKEYETYQINKIQVNIFNVKCLGDIATRRQSLFSHIRHESQRHLQNLTI
ncbi:Protein CBG05233, partial [Caenorhabditis briggsae]